MLLCMVFALSACDKDEYVELKVYEDTVYESIYINESVERFVTITLPVVNYTTYGFDIEFFIGSEKISVKHDVELLKHGSLLTFEIDNGFVNKYDKNKLDIVIYPYQLQWWRKDALEYANK